MMEKWSITPAPSPDDSQRHRLEIKGDLYDVNKILKKLGAICGRPLPGEGEFNFLLFLSVPGQAVWEKVTKTLEDLGPGSAQRGGEPAPAPAPAPAPTPMPALTPAPVMAAAPLPTKPLFGSEDKLDEKRTFDTLLVGSYNRFAHAAATSAVGNPGKMYQPLFIFGNPGVGKTHMLNAIAGSLAKNGPVWLTSGGALARAVSRAVQEKKFGELEAHAAKVKALLIDDVHLLAINESNQMGLAKLFKIMLDAGSQVVLTSLYPPRALSALEDALRISFAKGWSVDMKMPNPEVQKEMIVAYCDRFEMGFSQDDVKLFIDKAAGPNFPDFNRSAQRWKFFTKHRDAKGQPKGAYEVLGVLFNPGPPSDNSDVPTQAVLDAAKGYQPPAPAAGAMSLAVIVPKGAENHVPWLLKRFHEVGSTFMFQRSYRQVLVQSYDPEQPFGVAFQIAEACQRAGAEATLILGPQAETKLATRLNDFSHAVGHILNSFGLAMGFIPHKGCTHTMPMLHAHLDFHLQKP
jgi:hypothetical protein